MPRSPTAQSRQACRCVLLLCASARAPRGTEYNIGKAIIEEAFVLCLQERLAAFETEQPDGMTEATDEVSSFEWRGVQYQVSAETIRAALAPVATAERELSADPAAAAGASGPSDLRLVKLDRLGNAYAGALAAVQSAVANGAPSYDSTAIAKDSATADYLSASL